MRLSAFETYAHERIAELGLTIKAVAEAVGVCRATLYRKFQHAPWREGRGTFEGRFFTRLAVALSSEKGLSATRLDRERKLLLWLSGFNPFVEQGLSQDTMLDLYATVEQRIAELAEKWKRGRGA